MGEKVKYCECKNTRYRKFKINVPVIKEGYTIITGANAIKCKKCKKITFTETERKRVIKAIDAEYNKLFITGKIKPIFEEVVE